MKKVLFTDLWLTLDFSEKYTHCMESANRNCG